MAKLLLDDVFRISDNLSELLDANVGREFVYQRLPDAIFITFNPVVIAALGNETLLYETAELVNRLEEKLEQFVEPSIDSTTPTLDADQEAHERHIR